jgi:hypothetical protein
MQRNLSGSVTVGLNHRRCCYRFGHPFRSVIAKLGGERHEEEEFQWGVQDRGGSCGQEVMRFGGAGSARPRRSRKPADEMGEAVRNHSAGAVPRSQQDEGS